jgi:hypothetical protein
MLTLAWSMQTQAAHHAWQVNEVFSNADGTIQFVELFSGSEGHTRIGGFEVFSDDDTSNLNHAQFTFPGDLAGSTLNKYLLLATPDFQNAFGIPPDYLIPAGFLVTGAGTVQYESSFLSWAGTIPMDAAAATPRNFADATGVFSVDTRPPELVGIPFEPLIIQSNSVIPDSHQAIVDFLAPISCTDDTDPSPTLTLGVPAEFPAGATTAIAITCVDADANQQTGQVSVSVETFTDTDGDGVGDDVDADDDNDTVEDDQDAFPLDATESVDTDSDGVGNNADADDDGDGVEDSLDAFPLDASETVDSDGDGIGDNSDTDDEVPPVILLVSPYQVDATGHLTDVDFSTVRAEDNKDGPVEVSSDRSGPPFGKHAIGPANR